MTAPALSDLAEIDAQLAAFYRSLAGPPRATVWEKRLATITRDMRAMLAAETERHLDTAGDVAHAVHQLEVAQAEIATLTRERDEAREALVRLIEDAKEPHDGR